MKNKGLSHYMKHIIRIIQIILIVVIVVFTYQIIKIYVQDKDEQESYAKIQKKFKTLSNEHQSSVRPQFESLEKINKDIVGWIQLEGTSLNYPILQGKTNHEYLNLDFEREQRRKGSIFMDYRNSLNPLDKNTVIYGHHIGDQTMFDVLDDYLKQSFYDKHKSIHFDTKYGKYQLQIFSAFKTTSNDNYIQTTFDNDEQFKAFLLKTKKRSLIKTNVEVNEGDKIVTLSTCEDAFRQTAGRIAVVAKLTKIN